MTTWEKIWYFGYRVSISRFEISKNVFLCMLWF